MLRILTGKAGSGKTSAIMEEIRAAVERGAGGRMLIVPEQYSHEAERELCRCCGDTLSLYAEVFSFTALARRVMSSLGGGAVPYLDNGGRLLCMALALKDLAPELRVYSSAARRAELQNMLLGAVDELKAACVSPDMLLDAAALMDDSLGDKLRDLALVLESYDAVVGSSRADPADRLTVLASQIAQSDIGPSSHVYVDGFIDFTRQELAVLGAMMKKGAELMVCLTMDDINGDNEIFALSRRSARILLHTARELGIDTLVEKPKSAVERADALGFYADNMFSYSRCRYEGGGEAVSLWRAGSISAECELAAAKAIELVRGTGCRWRDIAVAVRGFEDYRGTLESVFRHYGVPLFTARKSDMLSKPLPAMISAAYETVLGGWDTDDVISYMRTGLTGLDSDECDKLGSYIFKWQLRASAWQRPDDWRQHPDGYGGTYDDACNARLAEINGLRRRLSAPLLAFAAQSSQAETASMHARALAGLLETLKLPELLSARAAQLRAGGREALAAECEQLWGITVSALEQCDSVLGDMPMDAQEFSRLFTLVLSKYDIGLIPVSLDMVSAGDFDRNRRRNIKHLIVLGASDGRLPQTDEPAGVFSEEDRQRLLENDIDLGGGENELWREFSLIYTCLAMPSDTLTLCCPVADADGAEQRPAFVFNRAKAIFGLEEQYAELGDIRISARAPAMSLAAQALRQPDGRSLAVLEYFRAHEPGRCAAIERAANMTRGRLSPAAVERLYGKKLRLSASRIDKFASCRFAYFCQYGLKAKPSEPASFEPPEIGTFMHYILENTAREVKARGGFSKVTDEELKTMTDGFVSRYVSEKLDDFREKSSRFRYLFRRICDDAFRVVCDMAVEFRKSSFEPLDFELDFSNAQEIEPVEIGGEDGRLVLTGIADRVDGWLHEGKLYLRVVDYKTGRKKFSLSDVWYGMGLQMLLYLFALEESGQRRYGREVVPAGIMYVPARSALLSADERMDDESAERARLGELRRSGLVLDEPALIEAWEHGEDKSYIPIRLVRGKLSSDSLATAERLGVLERHIKQSLTDMAKELRAGSISADPFYRSQQENACLNCDYYDACHFAAGENGENNRYMPRLSPDKVWNLMEGEDSDE